MMMFRIPPPRPSAGRAAQVVERWGPVRSGGRGDRLPVLFAVACVACVALPEPAAAIQVLDASDHAELEAAVSATGVSRVAVADDRIRRVIRSPGGFDVEHDATSGDLYLRPLGASDPAWDEFPVDPLPITLFLGTERGFTYRLTLTPDVRPSAQVLIRNPATSAGPMAEGPAGAIRDARVAELVRLVRAVARREPLPGYVVEPSRSAGQTTETWRGARFVAHVLTVDPGIDATALPERFATGVAAVWIAAPHDPGMPERIAVVVTEPGRPGAGR